MGFARGPAGIARRGGRGDQPPSSLKIPEERREVRRLAADARWHVRRLALGREIVLGDQQAEGAPYLRLDDLVQRVLQAEVDLDLEPLLELFERSLGETDDDDLAGIEDVDHRVHAVAARRPEPGAVEPGAAEKSS